MNPSNLQAPQKLHALNGIRVIAEYLVVRHHVLRDHMIDREGAEGVKTSIHGRGPIGMDIMCFFFVLSGFVMTYTHENADFTGWERRKAFIQRRLMQVYPVFLFCWLCACPNMVYQYWAGIRTCWARPLCTVLQLGMLDAWFGCGFTHPALAVSWFLSCLVWLWFAFPFCKDYLVDRVFTSGAGFHNIWYRLIAMNVIWAGLCFLLWGYSIYTLAGFPLLRAGDFLIGCGAACALRAEIPWFLERGRFWYPVVAVLVVYNLEGLNHGMNWLCLHERSSREDCSLWRYGQEWREASSPCITLMEKIPNKYALVWAGLVHGVARAELKGETDSWVMRLLMADGFRFLSVFSLTLYVAHINLDCAIKWLGQTLFGWQEADWTDDTAVIVVYLACYGLHCAIVNVMTEVLRRQEGEWERTDKSEPVSESSQLVVEDILETDEGDTI